jgi:trehalose synthase
MARRIEIGRTRGLDEYESYAPLAPAVRELRAEARQMAPTLSGRTLWMINSTAHGGGVAEMLPAMIGLFRDVGLRTEWVVIEAEDADFFPLTKRLHNLLHGEGDPTLTESDRALYERVNRQNAEALRSWLRPGDILAVHDPQPMPLASLLHALPDLHCVWRCHIGVDEQNAQTRAAWRFLRPYAGAYRRAIFSAPEYLPDFLAARSTIIYPAIDPLTDKNRDLSVHKISGVLANAALSPNPGPVLTPPFEHVAERLLPNGAFAPANMVEDIGLLYRPIVTQVSRWDRLKGFGPLLEAFAVLKARVHENRRGDPVHTRRLELTRLVLAGPEPASVADDPEAVEVLEELIAQYGKLDPAVQRDVALLALPMRSRSENALMVNALQRTSSIVVQNSLREGFGLTVAEAMWKRLPVLSNRRAVGPRYQVRDGVDGCLIDEPRDVGALAEALNRMLASPGLRDTSGRAAQRHVFDRFLVFTQVLNWLRLLSNMLRDARTPAS